MFGLFFFILDPIKCQTYCRCTRTVPTHTSIQVVVHCGLPDFTWAYTHGKEVVTCALFKYKRQLCTYTQTHKHSHKRIYTHKPSMLLTRTFAQQRGSGVFSFNPTHATLAFHTVSQTASIIHTHTQAQIYTFSHANLFFFFSWRPHPLFLFFHTGTHKCTQAHTHTQINTLPATRIPAHDTDAQFVWSSRKQGSLGQARLKICHMQLRPHSYKSQSRRFMPAIQFLTARVWWQGQSHSCHCHTPTKLCMTKVPLIYYEKG